MIRNALLVSTLALSFIGAWTPLDDLLSPDAIRTTACESTGMPTAVRQAPLTLAERVDYQHRLERLAHQHRIAQVPDPKPRFEQAMPPDAVRTKVERYLRLSAALETFWQQPLTAEQLQAEMDRMARDTRRPERLREMFAALDNDPYVIAECLARPLLAERLVRQRHVQDDRWRDELPTKRPVDPSVPSAEQRFDAWWSILDGDDRLAAVSPPAEEIAAFATPAIVESACAGDDSWWPVFPGPSDAGRQEHTAVWTGEEMLVWGGTRSPSSYLGTGSRYSPATDSWVPMTTAGGPSPRGNHTAVWTGQEMIVWGGYMRDPNSETEGPLGGGRRYSPATDSWTPVASAGAPSPRSGHTAVWTGTEMVVWGGSDWSPTVPGGSLDTGGRYAPSTDTWVPTGTGVNVPSPRSSHTAVWTGAEMVVWGSGSDSTGGRYSPATDSWEPTSTEGAPDPRTGHTAVWTGYNMVVWGGYDPARGYFNTGGRYSPGPDSWVPTNTAGAPDPRSGHTAVWTGSEMVVWGGAQPGAQGTGGRYSPNTESWAQTTSTGAPSPRTHHTAVWTGSEMIVWGGFSSSEGYPDTGGRYCASTCTLREWFRDEDRDTWANPAGSRIACDPPGIDWRWDSRVGDCDDTRSGVNPDAVEGLSAANTCSDGLDNDCDGKTDLAESACLVPLYEFSTDVAYFLAPGQIGVERWAGGVTVELLSSPTQALVQNAVTGGDGVAWFTGVQAGHYVMRPRRTEPLPAPSVTPADAALVVSAWLGTVAPLSPEQRLAADVSGDRVPGISDASLIMRHWLGRVGRFPVAAALSPPSDLGFVPSSVPIDVPPDGRRSFTAYGFGDVNGDWGPTPVPGGAIVGASVRLGLRAKDVYALDGRIVWSSQTPDGPTPGLARRQRIRFRSTQPTYSLSLVLRLAPGTANPSVTLPAPFPDWVVVSHFDKARRELRIAAFGVANPLPPGRQSLSLALGGWATGVREVRVDEGLVRGAKLERERQTRSSHVMP